MAISILALGIYFYLDENKEVICDDATGTTPNGLGAGTTEMLTSTVEPCDPNPDGFSQDTLDALGWLPLVSLLIYMFAFSIGFGPVPWMMNSEFFSMESRGLASGT